MAEQRLTPARRWAIAAIVALVAILAVPLWLQFHEPSMPVWNVILAAMLIGVVVGTFFLQRFFMLHLDDIGQAQFDTRNREDSNG
jgi:putative effector of murein hydrolase